MEITKEIIEKFKKWIKLKIRIYCSEPKDRYFYDREIWWASLGANIGFEQDGKNDNFERPVLVLKKFNKDVLWILPLTSKDKNTKNKKYYFQTKDKEEVSFIILSQLRLISSKRLLRHLRTLPEEEFNEVRKRVKEFI